MSIAAKPIYELKGVSLVTTRKTHIRRLNDILYLSLERNDLPRARRAWSILSQCKEFDWKEHWRTGLFLVPSEESEHPSRQKVDFLRRLMRFYPVEVFGLFSSKSRRGAHHTFTSKQEAILLEMIILFANDGLFHEALDELDLHLPSLPYQDNTVMHTYAGILSFKLAENSASSEMQTALKHFRNALNLDTENAVASQYTEKITQIGVRDQNGDVDVEADDDDDDANALREVALINRTKRSKQSNGP